MIWTLAGWLLLAAVMVAACLVWAARAQDAARVSRFYAQMKSADMMDGRTDVNCCDPGESVLWRSTGSIPGGIVGVVTDLRGHSIPIATDASGETVYLKIGDVVPVPAMAQTVDYDNPFYPDSVIFIYQRNVRCLTMSSGG